MTTVGENTIDLSSGGALVGDVGVGLDELLRRDGVRVVAAFGVMWYAL